MIGLAVLTRDLTLNYNVHYHPGLGSTHAVYHAVFRSQCRQKSLTG